MKRGRFANLSGSDSRRPTQEVRHEGEAGLEAPRVVAKTPAAERAAALAEFAGGSIKVVSYVDSFGQGIDAPNFVRMQVENQSWLASAAAMARSSTSATCSAVRLAPSKI